MPWAGVFANRFRSKSIGLKSTPTSIRTGDRRAANRAKDSNRWYDVYAFRFGAAEKNQIAILFNDITARKQTEANAALLASISKIW